MFSQPVSINSTTPPGDVIDITPLPRLRPAATVFPQTPISNALAILRESSTHTLPVVDYSRILLGEIMEAELALLLSSRSPAERINLLTRPSSDIMTAAAITVPASSSVNAALTVLRTSGRGSLPVVDDSGRLMGLLSAADLVHELSQSMRPPMLGGLATPFGVYLTGGNITGGVGSAALIITGIAFCAVHLASYYLTVPVTSWTMSLPMSVRPTIQLFLESAIQVGLLLTIVRNSRMAGYHAAEHQVVHAVERGEPLTVDVVRQMPRVHPRCGTNLVSGALIASLIGILLQPLIGSLGFLIGGATALAVWRNAGAWMQMHITTRPASEQELESGIRAAREVIVRYQKIGDTETLPFRRIWNMGFLPMIAGFLLGCAIVWGLSFWFPALNEPLHSYLLG